VHGRTLGDSRRRIKKFLNKNSPPHRAPPIKHKKAPPRQLLDFPAGRDILLADRGALRSQGRDFPTRGKDPPNLMRVVPP